MYKGFVRAKPPSCMPGLAMPRPPSYPKVNTNMFFCVAFNAVNSAMHFLFMYLEYFYPPDGKRLFYISINKQIKEFNLRQYKMVLGQ